MDVAPPAFFEGPEKKIEIVVVDGSPSLRAFGDERWERVVRAAGAEILSKRSNECFDAFLLSESSLFVYDSFLTMITCGRTQIADAVAEILTFVSADDIAVAFYERKSEHFPHEQATTFFEDARRIKQWLPGLALGFGAEHEHAVYLFHTERPYTPEETDFTLEVLMHGIDREVAARFSDVDLPADGSVARAEGLGDVLSGFDIDEHLFEPAGYSLNALRGEAYATVHVTPEKFGSYVSFETNMDLREDASSLIDGLVRIFRPESFDIVAFVPDERPMVNTAKGYLQRKHMRALAAGYWVTFQHFYRPAHEPTRAFAIEL